METKKTELDSCSLTVAKGNYQQAMKARFFSGWKKKNALKSWEKIFDEIKIFYESFETYQLLGEYLPPSRKDEYKKRLLLLAETKEQKKICENLPVFAEDKVNLERLRNAYIKIIIRNNHNNDFNKKEKEKAFNEEWDKPFHGDLKTLLPLITGAPDSKRSEVFEEIVELAESLKDFREIFKINDFFNPEERSVLLKKKLEIGEKFIFNNADPVVLANNSFLLEDYQAEIAIFKSSKIIAEEKDDKKVRAWFDKINDPGKLKEKAYYRFFLTARSQEEGMEISIKLSFEFVNIFVHTVQIGHFDAKKGKTVKKIWTNISLRELRKTKTAEKAVAILKISIPDLIKNQKAFKHLLFLINDYHSGSMIFDKIVEGYGQDSFEALLILERWSPFLRKEITENQSFNSRELLEKLPKNSNIRGLLVKEALKAVYGKNGQVNE